MRLDIFLSVMALFLFSAPATADTPLIRTTASDSSNVSFIARTPLSWETVEYDSQRYTRFTDCPVTDSIGIPELPMITCLVAIPDSVTPQIEFSFTDEKEERILPVYPAPAQIILSNNCTPSVIDSFVQDTTAYTSTSFWPAVRVRLIGETRICDQRLLQIQLFPAQYRAADSTLSTVTSFSVSISYDSSEAVWSNIGLGMFQEMIKGSPIVGYSPEDQTHAPVPEYFGKVDPEDGPSRMPDYVIICASGLFDQCEDAIGDLAEHRVSLNGFDVALVTTGDILEEFGGNDQTVITDETIRAFTEHMCSSWPQAAVKIPGYLLLIGDHEDSAYGSADWFLPTHIYDYGVSTDSPIYDVGNDEWYAYLNDDPEINNDIPSMAVGRISIKNGSSPQTDTLSVIIQNLIAMENPVTQIPIPDNRRRISRLTGTGTEITKGSVGTGYQTPLNWDPSSEWTSGFTEWLGYGYTTNYCGDGRDFTSIDGSAMASWEWRERCLSEYEKGAGIIFYSDHGSFHMFSAGLEWLPQYIPLDPETKGALDSTFNNYQIANNLSSVAGHAAPFTLLLCCSAGTYNHTAAEHEYPEEYPELCFYDGLTSPPIAAYDFSTDCLGETLQKNTSAPVSGVFCGSRASSIGCYGTYGRGILEAIYSQGYGRLGDAIMAARVNEIDYFLQSTGGGVLPLGQFNLLGDPALDISDYVRYPNSCDLVVHQDFINISNYPVETSSGSELPLSFQIRNNGRQNSGNFSTRITITDGSDTFTHILSCSSLNSRSEEEYTFTWTCPTWFDTPVELKITIEADYNHNCSDSWFGNNTASKTVQLNDIYPFNSGWPVEVTGNISTTPLLVNLDSDTNLEIVALCGSYLTAFDHDGSILWSIDNESFLSKHPIAADLDQDGDFEIVAAYEDGIKTISNTGTILDELECTNSVFVVGNMHPRTGLELCTADDNTLYLYHWNTSQTGFSLITSKDLGFSEQRPAVSLVCNDLGGDSFQDVAYLNGFFENTFPPPTEVKSISVYDWSGASMIYQHTWNEYLIPSVSLSAGILAGKSTIGYPVGEYEGSGDPAMLIEPDESTPEISCSSTGVLTAKELMYGVFADWNSLAPGTDAFILPSERQCMAWDDAGDPFGDFPTSNFGGDTESSPISPTALGNLDGTGIADVLFSTVLNGDWTLIGLDFHGNELTAIGFPFTLPENVSAGGGFAVGDLDRDGKVEIVFGTSDGYLHCWELGTCSTGYAPWCQFQHDCGRSGVLE